MTTLSLYVSSELVKRLQSAADKNAQSLSGLACLLIERGLKSRTPT